MYLIFSNLILSSETAKESDTDSISNMAYHVREDNDFEPQNDESEESLEENDGKGRFYVDVSIAYHFSKV